MLILPDNSSLLPFHSWGTRRLGRGKMGCVVLVLPLLPKFWWCCVSCKNGASLTLISSLWFLKTAQKSGNRFFYCSWPGARWWESFSGMGGCVCVHVCAHVQGFWAFKVGLRWSSLGDAHRWTTPAASWGSHTSFASGWAWCRWPGKPAISKPHRGHALPSDPDARVGLLLIARQLHQGNLAWTALVGWRLAPPHHPDIIFVAPFNACTLLSSIFITISTTTVWRPKQLC